MSAGDLVVADKQLEIWRSDTDRLLMGATTSYRLVDFEGLDMPAIRANDLEFPSDHGAVGGLELFAARFILATFWVRGSDSNNTLIKLEDLAKAFRPSSADIILTFQLPGQSRKRVLGRPRRTTFPHRLEDLVSGYSEAAIQFAALDPRIYSHTETSTTITIANLSSSQSSEITNNGNFPTRPTLSITGPATNPRVKNTQDSNREIKIDVVLGAADVLDIDIAKRTVKLNGADRYDLVRTDSQWWELLPGANTITFSRSTTTGSSPCVVKHRDTWDAA